MMSTVICLSSTIRPAPLPKEATLERAASSSIQPMNSVVRKVASPARNVASAEMKSNNAASPTPAK